VAIRADLLDRYRLDLKTARKRVYVLTDTGAMVSGMDAFIAIWSALPRWRVLGRLISLPVIRALAARFYDLILAPAIWRQNQRRRARTDELRSDVSPLPDAACVAISPTHPEQSRTSRRTAAQPAGHAQ
jgi:hypothetical protein